MPWLLRSTPTLLLSEMSRTSKKLLSERLSAIAESLPVGGVVCDVGSDHGILPLYLLQNNLADRVIVTDLNDQPLARGKAAIEEAGFSKNARFFLTDGILAVLQEKVDHFVIAGMGGETILGILSRAAEKIPVGTNFFLQPMTKIQQLRRYLYENGFCITDERLVYENKKYFVIISALFDGIKRYKADLIYEFGEFLPNQKGSVSVSYHRSALDKLNLKIRGMICGSLDCSFEMEMKHFLEEVLGNHYENS